MAKNTLAKDMVMKDGAVLGSVALTAAQNMVTSTIGVATLKDVPLAVCRCSDAIVRMYSLR